MARPGALIDETIAIPGGHPAELRRAIAETVRRSTPCSAVEIDVDTVQVARRFRPWWSLVKRTETCYVHLRQDATGVKVHLAGRIIGAGLQAVRSAVTGADRSAPLPDIDATAVPTSTMRPTTAVPRAVVSPPPGLVSSPGPPPGPPPAPGPPPPPTVPFTPPTAPEPPAPAVPVAPPAPPSPPVPEPVAIPVPEPEAVHDPDLDETTIAQRREVLPQPMAILVIDDGRTETMRDSIVVGRNPAAGGNRGPILKIDDPDRSVSKTHFAIGSDEQGVWVEDRHSTNGTIVVLPDGRQLPVASDQPQRVPMDTVVRFGGRWLRIVAPEPFPQS